MQTHELTAHPDHPPKRVEGIEARVLGFDENWVRLRWRVEGSQALIVPAFAGRGRAGELWRTTCFELFLRPDGREAYTEFNLSPSERWAAYDFDSYRAGMRERALPVEPSCTMRQGSSMAIFDAAVPLAGVPRGSLNMNLAAVIDEEGGHKSYWAMAHPPAKPDFHDPACFTGRLEAPGAA